MVLSELAARLNCAEYKNWVKAGHCLLLLRSCLQGFVGREVLSFHRGLLAEAPGLSPSATCRGGSRCSPRARQVIKCRNEIMHSSEMKVSSTWLRDFQIKIQNFLNEFRNIPEIVAVYSRIEQLLTSDWAVHIPEEDQRDGYEGETGSYLSASQVNEVKIELLKEELEEMYLQAEEQEMLPEEISNRLEVMKEFLRNNEDLRNGLREDMQKLDSLHPPNPKRDSKEPGRETPERKD
uniref:Chromosome X open reading frame 38 n=1 Tax=Urocitellus parryii TaxID=9999 RepID=A0A8D2GMV7_UROPR